ncbi:MAG: hypothetical protein ABII25_03220 [bacterium]
MKNILFIGIFLFLPHFAFSAFEEKPISARITGMGETFSAVEGGIEGIFYNPAAFKLKEEKNEIFSSYSELFDISELKHSIFAYGRTFSSDNKLGLAIQKFGSKLYCEEVKILNFSRRFLKKLDIGINVKEMSVKIESLDKYSTFGMDGGMQCEFYKNFRFGCVVKNFNGPGIIDDLPVIYRAGISCNVFKRIIWAFDWEKEKNFEDNFHLGQEICLNKFLFVRTGYETEPGRVSGGLGLKIMPIQIDYSIFSHSVLGNTQIFSFIIGW